LPPLPQHGLSVQYTAFALGLAKLSIPCENLWHTDTVKGGGPNTVSVCHELGGMEYSYAACTIRTLDLYAEVRILQPQPEEFAELCS
jgi:hypothetical protein